MTPTEALIALVQRVAQHEAQPYVWRNPKIWGADPYPQECERLARLALGVPPAAAPEATVAPPPVAPPPPPVAAPKPPGWFTRFRSKGDYGAAKANAPLAEASAPSAPTTPLPPFPPEPS
jgi:hypothetical protein